MSNIKDKIDSINSLESTMNIPTHRLKDILNILANSGGIKKVKDVSELDDNAEIGELSIVAKEGGLVSKTTRELKEIPYEQIDTSAMVFNVTGLDRVTSVEILPIITDISVLEGLENRVNNAILLTTSYTTPDTQRMYAILYWNIDIVVAINMKNQDEMYVLCIIENSKIKITEDGYEGAPGLKAFNELLKNNEFYFIGFYIPTLQNQPVSEGVHIAYSNLLFEREDPSKADLYIKKDEWELYKDPDVVTNTTNVESLNNDLNNKQSVIKIDDSQQEYRVYVDPNTCVKLQDFSHSQWTVYFQTTSFSSENKIDKYMIEISVKDRTVTPNFYFKNGTHCPIKWVDGIAPVIEVGYTYLITVINGFGNFIKCTNQTQTNV